MKDVGQGKIRHPHGIKDIIAPQEEDDDPQVTSCTAMIRWISKGLWKKENVPRFCLILLGDACL